ncbi:MAG: hypothetical protein AAEJ57_06350, partial [Opitutales bacterium]
LAMVVGVMTAKHLTIPFLPQGMSLRGWFCPQVKGVVGRSDADHRLSSLHPRANRFHLGYLWCSPANAHEEQISFGQSLFRPLQVIPPIAFARCCHIACGEAKRFQFGFKKSSYRSCGVVFMLRQNERNAWSCGESRAAR